MRLNKKTKSRGRTNTNKQSNKRRSNNKSRNRNNRNNRNRSKKSRHTGGADGADAAAGAPLAKPLSEISKEFLWDDQKQHRLRNLALGIVNSTRENKCNLNNLQNSLQTLEQSNKSKYEISQGRLDTVEATLGSLGTGKADKASVDKEIERLNTALETINGLDDTQQKQIQDMIDQLKQFQNTQEAAVGINKFKEFLKGLDDVCGELDAAMNAPLEHACGEGLNNKNVMQGLAGNVAGLSKVNKDQQRAKINAGIAGVTNQVQAKDRFGELPGLEAGDIASPTFDPSAQEYADSRPSATGKVKFNNTMNNLDAVNALDKGTDGAWEDKTDNQLNIPESPDPLVPNKPDFESGPAPTVVKDDGAGDKNESTIKPNQFGEAPFGGKRRKRNLTRRSSIGGRRTNRRSSKR